MSDDGLHFTPPIEMETDVPKSARRWCGYRALVRQPRRPVVIAERNDVEPEKARPQSRPAVFQRREGGPVLL